MTIIPEMFNKTEISIDKIIKLALSSIIRRKVLGLDYGTVVVAEACSTTLRRRTSSPPACT